MSSLQRPLSGDALLYHLRDEEATTSDNALLERNGRNARTLVKEGPLRVTMIVIAQGGGMPSHHTEGPIAVHVLNGAMEFIVAGQRHDLSAGDLLSVGPGVEHSVSSADGATFLLTVAHPAV